MVLLRYRLEEYCRGSMAITAIDWETRAEGGVDHAMRLKLSSHEYSYNDNAHSSRQYECDWPRVPPEFL